jgi:hypothetical protein
MASAHPTDTLCNEAPAISLGWSGLPAYVSQLCQHVASSPLAASTPQRMFCLRGMIAQRSAPKAAYVVGLHGGCTLLRRRFGNGETDRQLHINLFF